MIAFGMSVIVAGYVQPSMGTARHETEVKHQRKLDEIAGCTDDFKTQLRNKCWVSLFLFVPRGRGSSTF